MFIKNQDPKDEYIVALKQQLKKLKMENVSLKRQQSDRSVVYDDQDTRVTYNETIQPSAINTIPKSSNDHQFSKLQTHSSPSDDDIPAHYENLTTENNAFVGSQRGTGPNSQTKNLMKSTEMSDLQHNVVVNSQQQSKIKRKKNKKKGKKSDRPSNTISHHSNDKMDQDTQPQNIIQADKNVEFEKRLKNEMVQPIQNETEVQLNSQNFSKNNENDRKYDFNMAVLTSCFN